MRRILLAAAALAVGSGTAGGARAQASPFTPPAAAEHRVPVTLVLVDGGLPTSFFRRSSADARNVILVNAATADERELSLAVFTLLNTDARDSTGVERSDNLLGRVRPNPDIPVYPWAAEALQRLKAADRQHIHGLPEGRTLPVWLPPAHLVPRG